jgi:hypothetical protein
VADTVIEALTPMRERLVGEQLEQTPGCAHALQDGTRRP